jgi:hypothetical protein
MFILLKSCMLYKKNVHLGVKSLPFTGCTPAFLRYYDMWYGSVRPLKSCHVQKWLSFAQEFAGGMKKPTIYLNDNDNGYPLRRKRAKLYLTPQTVQFNKYWLSQVNAWACPQFPIDPLLDKDTRLWEQKIHMNK